MCRGGRLADYVGKWRVVNAHTTPGAQLRAPTGNRGKE
jgi:hypothetical protein